MSLVDIIKPNTIDEAKNAINKYKNSKILAGGTDLIIDIRKAKINPVYIIAINDIEELQLIKEDDKNIILGSCVTFSELNESVIVEEYFPSLIQCAKAMGSPQIRNMATIGGNLINASSAADITPCLIALVATLTIESINYTRVITCEDYFKNYNTEKLKENEILTFITIKKSNYKNGFYKLGKRNSLSIARVSAAVSLKANGNIIEDISICLGAVGRFPFKVESLESEAINKDVNWLYSKECLCVLEEYVLNSIRGRSTVDFKKEAIKGVFKHALDNAIDPK